MGAGFARDELTPKTTLSRMYKLYKVYQSSNLDYIYCYRYQILHTFCLIV
jgi:hypothetical protein